ncbi:MAG: hypothetical protein Q9208_006518 [Pyrenodesmia sp. 3 TL-2023]
MKEARLLHFSARPRGQCLKPGAWHLSCPASKGMPIKIDHQPNAVETFGGKMVYVPGILEAITELIGEGGSMYGWQLYSIGAKYEAPPGVMNAVAIVVREEGTRSDVEQWLDTPSSSETLAM